MDKRYAIKRSDQWLWSCNLTREEVLARIEDHRIGREWLICPQGTTKHAVEIGRYIEDPAIFSRLAQADAEKAARQSALIASIEKPPLLKVGPQLLKCSFICLMAGSAIVKVFFPGLAGAGLTPITLTILISVWSMGCAGIIAWLIGWLQHRRRVRATLKHYGESANSS